MIEVKNIKTDAAPWWKAQTNYSGQQEGPDAFGAMFASAQKTYVDHHPVDTASNRREQEIERLESHRKPRSRNEEEAEDRAREKASSAREANETGDRRRDDYDLVEAAREKRPVADEETCDAKAGEAEGEADAAVLAGASGMLSNPSAGTQGSVKGQQKNPDGSGGSSGQISAEQVAADTAKTSAQGEGSLKVLVGEMAKGNSGQSVKAQVTPMQTSIDSETTAQKQSEKVAAQAQMNHVEDDNEGAADSSRQKLTADAEQANKIKLGMDIPGFVIESQKSSLDTHSSGRQSFSQPDTMMVHGFKPHGLEDKMSPQGILSGQPSEAGDVSPQKNIEEIIKSAKAAIGQGSSRIQIRLDPPELGTLRIEIRQNSEGLQLQFHTSTAKAQQLLQEHSAELKSALEAQGLPATHIDIQLRLPTPEGPAGDSRGNTGNPNPQPQPDFQQSSEQGFTSSQGQNWSNESWREDLSPTGGGEESPADWKEMAFARLDVKV